MLSGCLVGEGAQIWFPWQVCVSVCTGRYPGFGTSPKACHNFSSWCVDGNQDLILFVPHWHTCSAVQLHLAKNARGGNSLNTVVTVLTALCCVWLFFMVFNNSRGIWGVWNELVVLRMSYRRWGYYVTVYIQKAIVLWAGSHIPRPH